METFELSNVYGAIVLDTRRAKSDKVDNVKYPIKYRLTHERKQIYFKSGFDITVHDWERLQITRDSELKSIRVLLKVGFKSIESTVEGIIKEGEYSHEKLKTLLKYGKNQKVYDAFEQIIQRFKKAGKVGSATIYTCAQKYIHKYDKNAQLTTITPTWLERFEKYALKSERKLSATTLAIYLRCLRAVFNYCINNKTLKVALYPFARNESETNKYKIREGSGTKIALTEEQIRSVKNFNAPTKSMERSRDLFLLMFYCAGLNFKDLCLAKWENIVDGELIYQRQKTLDRQKERDVVIKITLIPEAFEIIEKYGNKDKMGYILPYLSDNLSPEEIFKTVQFKLRQVNKHLKKIGKELKIDGLTSYVSRHSYATILKNRGVPIALISETLGHTTIKTTEGYLKKFEKEQRAKTFEILSNL